MGGPPPPPPPVIPIDSVEEAKSSVAASTAALEATVERIGTLTDAERAQNVNGEWLAIESLRHIVFVIDVWLSKTIQGEDDPFHPIGIPPHFVPRKLPGSSIDPDATPTFEEVVEALRGRFATLEHYVNESPAAELERSIGTHAKTVGGGLSVIITELDAHNYFINRDLDIIEGERG